ncbi:HNH endonuclease signature motif containing protein [Agrobacterium sp. 22-221-1]
MHDADTFARMPALESTAEPPHIEVLLHTFEKEREAVYRQEVYLVRDNGAVSRCARPQARSRRLDEVWTLGTFNKHSGYFEIAGHVVHRIVATAFHGARPTPDHVVDHIDSNRLNNRAENLRWVTRLENILLNPITRARIEIAYGSLEAFFKNPSACFIPKWDWMRVVTKEQAEESRKRLRAWAEKGQVRGGGSLGDWLYEPMGQSLPTLGVHDNALLMAAQREALDVPTFTTPLIDRDVRRPGAVLKRAVLEPESLDTPSLTPNAFQRKWRTPTEFPNCPETSTGNAVTNYLERLTRGAVFARNCYGENIVVEAATGPGNIISIVCSAPPDSVKGWTHAKVYCGGQAFCHESGGTFFSNEGAMKAHCITIGAPYDAYEDSIDDYC